jgi:hypothetical protein
MLKSEPSQQIASNSALDLGTSSTIYLVSTWGMGAGLSSGCSALASAFLSFSAASVSEADASAAYLVRRPAMFR